VEEGHDYDNKASKYYRVSLVCQRLTPSVTTSRADREVVVHPDDDTENLRTALQGALRVAPGHFKVGGVPDLRYE